jgi:hypothetical protein
MSVQIAIPRSVEIKCSQALRQMLNDFKKVHNIQQSYEYRTLVDHPDGEGGEWIFDDYHGWEVQRLATPVEVEWMKAYYVLLTFFKCLEANHG